MATPNYGFEKRQRELAKKRKKEDKLKAKAERKSGNFDSPDEGDREDPSAQTGAHSDASGGHDGGGQDGGSGGD